MSWDCHEASDVECRQQGEVEWSQLSLEGLTLHDASALDDPSQPGALALGDKAGYTNAVLRLIYPRGNDIAATDVVAFLRAGQVILKSHLHSVWSGNTFNNLHFLRLPANR